MQSTCEPPPILESWYRTELPKARFDISSSGVQPYSFADFRRIVELDMDEVDALLLQDSVSFGASALRRAISDRYAPGKSDHVMVTHGSSESIALTLSTLLEPGWRVVVADPIYHALRTYAELKGCEVVRFPIAPMCGADWRVAFESKIDSRTRAVIVNFPHNPTGMTPSADALRYLAVSCQKIGAILFWDGAMEELFFDANFGRHEPHLTEQVVRLGTLSKAFGLPGLRVGWCIASPPLLNRMLAMKDRTTLFLSPLIELLATRAIEHADKLIRPRLIRARRNLTLIDQWVNEHNNLVNWITPQGGVCGLLTILGWKDTELFCKRLVDTTGVLLVPGSAFELPQAVRIGYGGDTDELREGLQRIADFLANNRT